MKKHDPLDALRVWAGLAWCDASLSSLERSALEQLINKSLLLGAAQRSVALELLKTPAGGGISTEQALEAAGRLATLEAPLKEELYHATSLLAQIDGRLSAAEKVFLQRLRGELRLTEEAPDLGSSAPPVSRGTLIPPYADAS